MVSNEEIVNLFIGNVKPISISDITESISIPLKYKHIFRFYNDDIDSNI